MNTAQHPPPGCVMEKNSPFAMEYAPQSPAHQLRSFVTGTGHLLPVEKQRAALHADLATFIDDGLITSLEAVLTDAAFTEHQRPDRIQAYRPALELLQRLRAMQKAALRDAIMQVAGIAPH